MRAIHSIKRILGKITTDLKHKRSLEGILNYGLISFGHQKKDYFIRATSKPLIEHRIVTVRYLAVIDGFIIIGMAIGMLGHPIGWTIALGFFVLCIIVFVRARTIEKQFHSIQKTVKFPLKKTIAVIKHLPKALDKK